MGIEPFLVGSAMTMVVAQRLVRRPCPGCRAPDVPDPALLRLLGVDPALLRLLGVDPALLRDATPMAARAARSARAGYRGRTRVFEVLVVSPEVPRALGTNPT